MGVKNERRFASDSSLKVYDGENSQVVHSLGHTHVLRICIPLDFNFNKLGKYSGPLLHSFLNPYKSSSPDLYKSRRYVMKRQPGT